MTELIGYTIKVLLIQGIFYGFYFVVLRKSDKHTWNRFYLISTLILSFLIPFLTFPDSSQFLEPIGTNANFEWVIKDDISDEIIQHATATNVFERYGLYWVYFGVSGTFLVRFFMHLVFLQQLKKQSICIKKTDYKLYKTPHSKAFSFLKNIFVPAGLFGTGFFKQVVAHECAHVRQHHSIDRLLADFIVLLFWFNPFIYCYRNALIEIHEYLADQSVLQKYADPIGYQEALFAQLVSSGSQHLVSHFNFSMIKKRIVMMNKHNNKSTRWNYLVVIPMMLSVIFAFSSKRAEKHLNWIEGEITVMMLPVIPQLVVAEYPIPTIMPISRNSEVIVKMTSAYGMRYDPISKQERFHSGVDFGAPIGTSVIAPADGKVVEVETYPNGYGKRIVLKHGTHYETRFAHLSEFSVQAGQIVSKGQLIGFVGNSGLSKGPHLHYEVIKDGKKVDPFNYMSDYRVKIKLMDKVKSKNEIIE